MVDSPKVFLIVVISFILAISVISFISKIYTEQSIKDSTLNISVGSPKAPAVPQTKTSAPVQIQNAAPQNTYKEPTPSIIPQVTPDYVVNYTNTGFQPQTLNVAAGKTVRFLNQASASMRVSAATSPSAGASPDFSQSKTVGYGGYYDYTTNRKGTIVYYNINDTKKAGTLIVQ